MPMEIHCACCAAGAVLPLAQGVFTTASGNGVCPASTVTPVPMPVPMLAHTADMRPLPAWPVGTLLCTGGDTAKNKEVAVFKVTGRILLPTSPHALHAPLLTALRPVAEGEILSLTAVRKGRALAWITLSDKGAAGQREDLSGPAIGDMVREALPLCHEQGFMLPDDAQALRALLTELALHQGYDIICTTGGTGLGARDVSPQATLAVLDMRLPGFEQAMMAASLAKTPHAAISRAVAGVIGKSICINLPGSRKAVLENLAAVLPPLPHALDKLHGDPADCGG